MLIAKGYNASFKVVGKGWVKSPASFALLHDPSGKDFPRCAGFTSSFKRQDRDISNGAAKSYFENDPIGGQLGVDVPNALSAWTKVGPVEEVRYTRKCPGRRCSFPGQYYHPFEQGKRPVLYRRGRMLRLQLGSGCSWDWKGISYP